MTLYPDSPSTAEPRRRSAIGARGQVFTAGVLRQPLAARQSDHDRPAPALVPIEQGGSADTTDAVHCRKVRLQYRLDRLVLIVRRSDAARLVGGIEAVLIGMQRGERIARGEDRGRLGSAGRLQEADHYPAKLQTARRYQRLRHLVKAITEAAVGIGEHVKERSGRAPFGRSEERRVGKEC